jgi:catechol 2,3-dioxygenase-like lactoylglutathione lyase family enzyme
LKEISDSPPGQTTTGPFEILGLQHILICPRDWDESMRFWRDALGMPVAADWSDKDHGAAALQFGDSHIVVAGPEDSRDHEAGFPIQPGRPYIYATVRGLDALVANLKNRGVPILSQPVKLHWGPRVASAKDPDGVPILFVEGEPDPALVAKSATKSSSR